MYAETSGDAAEGPGQNWEGEGEGDGEGASPRERRPSKHPNPPWDAEALANFSKSVLRNAFLKNVRAWPRPGGRKKARGSAGSRGAGALANFFPRWGLCKKNGRRIVRERFWQRERAGGHWERVITPTFWERAFRLGFLRQRTGRNVKLRGVAPVLACLLARSRREWHGFWRQRRKAEAQQRKRRGPGKRAGIRNKAPAQMNGWKESLSWTRPRGSKPCAWVGGFRAPWAGCVRGRPVAGECALGGRLRARA